MVRLSCTDEERISIELKKRGTKKEDARVKKERGEDVRTSN